MSFRSVFIALVIGFGLVLAGYLINRQRPAIDTDQPSEAFVKATGKCLGQGTAKGDPDGARAKWRRTTERK